MVISFIILQFKAKCQTKDTVWIYIYLFLNYAHHLLCDGQQE